MASAAGETTLHMAASGAAGGGTVVNLLLDASANLDV